MKMNTAISVITILALVGLLLLRPTKEKIVYKTPPVDEYTSENVFEYINMYRNNNGLNTLSKSDALCRYATLRAYETDNYWNFADPHYKFKEDYENGNWLNPRYKMIFEILVKNHEVKLSPYEYFDLWRNSEEHNKIMLMKDFNYMCVSCVNKTCAGVFSADK